MIRGGTCNRHGILTTLGYDSDIVLQSLVIRSENLGTILGKEILVAIKQPRQTPAQ